jgi:hypothetical protein
MIPERGTKRSRKRAFLDCCSLEPRDGEMYFIPVKRLWVGDNTPWVVDGGNEEMVGLRKKHGGFPKYDSIPRWRWHQMLRTNGQLKFLGYES